MKRIWLTTDGRPHDSILAVFTSAERAERYRQLLVERYSLGKNLSLMGKPLARDADTWQLGLGSRGDGALDRRESGFSSRRVGRKGGRELPHGGVRVQHAAQAELSRRRRIASASTACARHTPRRRRPRSTPRGRRWSRTWDARARERLEVTDSPRARRRLPAGATSPSSDRQSASRQSEDVALAAVRPSRDSRAVHRSRAQTDTTRSRTRAIRRRRTARRVESSCQAANQADATGKKTPPTSAAAILYESIARGKSTRRSVVGHAEKSAGLPPAAAISGANALAARRSVSRLTSTDDGPCCNTTNAQRVLAISRCAVPTAR